ncbi:MAG: hypothetical protein RLZ45_1733 [Verrucomicrobiota bacterium]
MSDTSSTFSESWHRIASERPALRPDIRIQRQVHRGERAYVLSHPYHHQFFRISPEAYEFVARLDGRRTVDEIWQDCLELHPETAPGQEAALQLLGQLYRANLLQYRGASDTAELLRRSRATQRQVVRSRLTNILFARIPLVDPDRFLVRTLPFVGPLIGLWGGLAWLALVAWGLFTAVGHARELQDQAHGLLAPDNLVLLYATMVGLKALHELGHAYCCRRFGGEVHAMGVMLMLFTPMPYVDATAAWGFRERWKRALVGAAGMMVELAVAAVAVGIWSWTGPGAVHAIAYNVLLVASVSTLIFNLNPLLRFDGYYILSDLLGIPNLAARAQQQLRVVVEKALFGVVGDTAPARTRGEAWALSGYALGSGVYRVVVFGGLLLLLADRFFTLGLALAVVAAVVWAVTPVVRLALHLATAPRLARRRLRAIGVTTLLAGGLVALLVALPLPHHFRAPGLVESGHWSALHTGVDGEVIRWMATPGSRVEPGQPLVELRNPELDLRERAARAELEEIEARIRQALQDAIPNLKPLESVRDSVKATLRQLDQDRAALVVRSPQAGIWSLPNPEEIRGRWLTRGSPLGSVLDDRDYRFHAVVPQEEADRLFGSPGHHAEIRLEGESSRTLGTTQLQILPADRQRLPSAALGWLGGGAVAVSDKDPEGRRAQEPFFEVRATIAAVEAPGLRHGRSGVIRFDLPAEPLLPRWIRSLRQLLQRRYQV